MNSLIHPAAGLQLTRGSRLVPGEFLQGFRSLPWWFSEIIRSFLLAVPVFTAE